MPQTLKNPWRGTGLELACPAPVSEVAGVARLLSLCPAHHPTPLHSVPDLARQAQVAQIHIKDERGRMGLGSFKALGATHAIAREAAASVAGTAWAEALAGRTFVTASAGNHGLSVAAGAQIFGADAVIYLSQSVPKAFARRLEAKGARVVRDGETYEDSMAAAEEVAVEKGWDLLSDSTWDGYCDPGLRVMEGYLQLAAEAAAQMDTAPTHVVLQAGVGGLAAAVTAHVRAVWGDGPQVIVVEPEAAAALYDSISVGLLVTAEGPISAMGRLDCKTPSLVALKGLAQQADLFVTISEEEAAAGADCLARYGYPSTPSGAAGLAAILAGGLGIEKDARVLTILSEGPEDG